MQHPDLTVLMAASRRRDLARPARPGTAEAPRPDPRRLRRRATRPFRVPRRWARVA